MTRDHRADRRAPGRSGHSTASTRMTPLASTDELAAHGDCAECRRLEVRTPRGRGDAASRARSSPGRRRHGGPDPRPPARSDAVPPPRRSMRSRPGGTVASAGWRAAFGVAAAVALVLAIVLATRPGGGPVPETIVAFEGTPGELALAYTPGERGVLVWATGLPDPGESSVYELWMFEDGDPDPRRVPRADGWSRRRLCRRRSLIRRAPRRDGRILRVPGRPDDRPDLHRRSPLTTRWSASAHTRSGRSRSSPPTTRDSRSLSGSRALPEAPSARCRRGRRSRPPPPDRSGPSPGTCPTSRPPS